MERKGDIIVIGGGPAGYVAAITAAQQGKKVVLVEEAHLGGTCLNVGCIPTKALLRTAGLFRQLQELKNFGLAAANPAYEWSRVQARKDAVVNTLRNGVRQLLQANGVEVVEGRARFVDTKRLEVTPRSGAPFAVTGATFIICTGSQAADLPFTKADEEAVLTSTGALSLPALPKSLVIIGGGVIGVEFATLFRAFGVEVTVVELLPRLLPGLDQEAAQVVHTALSRDGVHVLTGTRVRAVTKEASSGVLQISLEGETEPLTAEKLLVAVGRVPRVADLNLAAAGLPQDRGPLTVNACLQTPVPHIYAAGDVIGGHLLAHVAYEEGRIAALNACGQRLEMDYRAVPMCVFTHPEVAQVGLGEEEARAQVGKVRVGKFPFAASGKALADGETTGFVKIVAEPETGELLGVVMVGPGATELIAAAALAVRAELTLAEVTDTIIAHPTLAEAFKEAALIAAGSPLHFPARG